MILSAELYAYCIASALQDKQVAPSSVSGASRADSDQVRSTQESQDSGFGGAENSVGARSTLSKVSGSRRSSRISSSGKLVCRLP